ncbi:MAG: transposase [Promethearchaeota archaeon]
MIIIKYRKKRPIIQTQLDDFLGIRSIERYESWVPRDYRTIRKKFKRMIRVRRYRRKKREMEARTSKCTRTLDLFFPVLQPPTLPKPPYLFRFRSIPRYLPDEYAAGIIPERELKLTRSLSSFTGFFHQMFDLNDFSLLDEFQEELENKGVKLRQISIHDVVAFEFLRLLLGFQDYTGLEKIMWFNGKIPLRGLLRDKLFFPRASDVSHVLTRIPPGMLLKFFHHLVDEAIDLKIIRPRVLIWDGQFMRSNCNNNRNKATGEYNDPDAGYYRHNGKKLGVGYKISNLHAYCGSWKRTFPVHFDVFPANRHDSVVFRKTLSNFLKRNVGTWKIVIADTGAYALENLKYCRSRGIQPLIRAKKNLVTHPTVEVRKGYWFNKDFFPPGWSSGDIRDAYKVRSAIEAAQASNNTFYNTGRMNTRGIDNATRSRTLNYCLDLVRALTATKLGRPDLISTLRAFTGSRDEFLPETSGDIARQSGYDLLLPTPAEVRQKEAMDNRRRLSEARKKSRGIFKS